MSPSARSWIVERAGLREHDAKPEPVEVGDDASPRPPAASCAFARPRPLWFRHEKIARGERGVGIWRTRRIRRTGTQSVELVLSVPSVLSAIFGPLPPLEAFFHCARRGNTPSVGVVRNSWLVFSSSKNRGLPRPIPRLLSSSLSAPLSTASFSRLAATSFELMPSSLRNVATVILTLSPPLTAPSVPPPEPPPQPRPAFSLHRETKRFD